MSIQLELRVLEGLIGSKAWMIKASFRESKQKTIPVRGQSSVNIGQTLSWPSVRPPRDKDILYIEAYEARKHLPGKLLGSVAVNLYSLSLESSLELRETLVDTSNHPTNYVLTFAVLYQSSTKDDASASLGAKQPTGDYGLDEGDAFDAIDNAPSAAALEAGYYGGDDISIGGDSMMSGPEKHDPRFDPTLGPTIYAKGRFQLAITIVEARKLTGTNINPFVTVNVNNEVQKTTIKYSTNRPFYDNYFMFDIQMPKHQLLAQTIRIRVLSARGNPVLRLLPGALIGEFVTDVQTVTSFKGSAIVGKWALLIDPKDPWAGPRGFVKLDMHLVEEGRHPQRIMREENDEEENIEANLLMPRSLPNQRRTQMVSMAVQVYQAEDLPPMHTQAADNIRQAFMGEGAANVDPYIEVSYAGLTGKTKIQRYNANPIWNESLIFTDYFPPLTHTLRVDVRNAGVKRELIATQLINLRALMSRHASGGNLPTFGPSWLNLYGTPRIYSYAQMLRHEDELNAGLGEPVAFRGRLLMAINSRVDDEAERVGFTAGIASPLSETVAGRKSMYFLFGAIYDAAAIDKKIGRKGKPIRFEISMGLFGNKLDGERGLVDPQSTAFTKPVGDREAANWDYSETEPVMPKSDDHNYYYLDYGATKPCVYLVSYFEDHRQRMLIPNILEKLLEFMRYATDRVRYLLFKRKSRDARYLLRRFMVKLSQRVEAVKVEVHQCRGTVLKTNLDIQYNRRVRGDLTRIGARASRIAKHTNRRNMGERMKEVNAMVRRVGELMCCPQDGLPDIFISMISDEQRIGFARIPARDIHNSLIDSERGKWSGQVTTIFIRKQGIEGIGKKGWSIQCQLRIYLWLSLLKDYANYQHGLPSGYPASLFSNPKPPLELTYSAQSRFELRCYIFIARNLLAADNTGLSDPMARVLMRQHVLETQPLYKTMSPMWDVMLHRSIVFYQDPESVQKELQEVIVEVFDIDAGGDMEFLGRCFSEVNVYIEGDTYRPPRLQWWPIARGQTQAGQLLAAFDLLQLDTKVPFQDVPSFEQMAAYTEEFNNLVILRSIPNMPLADADYLNRDSTDEDADGSRNLDNYGMSDDGGGFDSDTAYDADSILNSRSALTGAAATGYDTDEEEDEFSTTSGRVVRRPKKRQLRIGMAPPQLVVTRRPEDYRIPENIRPPLHRFRVEVVFWSMFGMVRRNLLPVKHPKVVMEIGGGKLESETMRDLTKKRLFEDKLKVIDVYLPVDERYWPPLAMICYESRVFGGKMTVGTYAFSNVREFLQLDPDAEEDDFSDSDDGLNPSHVNLGFDLGEPTGQSAALMSTADTIRVGGSDEPAGLNLGLPGSLPGRSTAPYPTRSDADILAGVNPSFQPDPEKPRLPADSAGLSQAIESEVRILEENEGPGGAAVPGQPTAHKTGPTKEQLETADWWTRFYATIQSPETYSEELVVDPLTESEDSDFGQKLDKIEVKPEPDDELVPDQIAPPAPYRKKKRWWKLSKEPPLPKNAAEKRALDVEKRRKARRKKKKFRHRVADKFRGDEKKRFYKEIVDLELNNLQDKQDTSWVEKLLILPTALEELPEYNNFVVPFRNIPLYKGKQEENELSPDHRLAGYMKGNLIIYAIEDGAPIPSDPTQLRLYKTLPQKAYHKLLVRVYIVRAMNLHPADPNGKADPYLVVSLGKVVIDEKAEYQPKELNPVFGTTYEFNASLPMDNVLNIQIMDHDRVGFDEMIGQTTIDIENRFHSPNRATCGLMENYEANGYAKWKDSQLPTEILKGICAKKGLPPPEYNLLENKVAVGDKSLYAKTEILSGTGGSIKSIEPLALTVLHNFSVIEQNTNFVREHVETRNLYHADKPGLIQGRLQMWVDIFDRSVAVPPPAVEIRPRKPVGYELRVIVWNTADVVLEDESIFSSERSVDIYVKGWMKGPDIDGQKTDVHYRSLSGEGNFNWRFLFPFQYIPAEDKIVYTHRGALELEGGKVRSNCELTLQVWDNDLVTSDNFLGTITMNLSSMPRMAKTSKSCGLHQLTPDCPRFSIFKNRKVRGWWPCTDVMDEEVIIQGKVECEMELKTALDAENSPVGLAREEPEGLPKPNRPDSSFFGFLGPLNNLRYFIKYKLKWFLIKLAIILIFVLILVLFIYTLPGAIANRIVLGRRG